MDRETAAPAGWLRCHLQATCDKRCKIPGQRLAAQAVLRGKVAADIHEKVGSAIGIYTNRAIGSGGH